jgi:hypothetical protein
MLKSSEKMAYKAPIACFLSKKQSIETTPLYKTLPVIAQQFL